MSDHQNLGEDDFLGRKKKKKKKKVPTTSEWVKESRQSNPIECSILCLMLKALDEML
jgi:hypothetical protein